MATEATAGGAPLAGAFICCTSIDPDTRDEIHRIAKDLGAECSLDLTVKATHLIIGATTSPKYNWVAKERPDMKVVFPQFIEAVRQVWVTGEEADVAALEKEYKVPALYGQKICITGFSDPTIREQLTSMIEANGAEYHADLTKKITQLIVNKPIGRKYEYALNWKVKVVGEEWLQDSAERGMRLDESLYSPSLNPSERGKGAWRKSLPEAYVAQLKRLRDESATTEAPNPTKIRRTMSGRQKSDVRAIWNDMKSVATSSRPSQSKNEWDDGRQENGPEELEAVAEVTVSKPEIERSVLQASGPKDIFSGLSVYVHGFSKAKFDILEQHITSHGGTVMDTASLSLETQPVDISSCYVMFPSDLPKQACERIPEYLHGAKQVNEWWVVTSLVAKKVASQPENRFCSRFYTGKIVGFEKLIICSSGFTGPDLLHLKLTTELLGATYHETMTSKANVLICGPKPSSDKLVMAKDHKIPAVSIDWVWDCIDGDYVADFATHAWKTPANTSSISQASQALEKKKEMKLVDKWQPDDSLLKAKQGFAYEKRPDDLKFKNVRSKLDSAVVDPPELRQDESIDTTGTILIGDDEEPFVLRETSPSKLNSPQRPASKSESENQDHTKVLEAQSDDAKVRTIALSAMLESKIATRSQSDGAVMEISFTKQRKVKALGRGVAAATRNNNLDESMQASDKRLMAEEESLEPMASQRLEYEDQAINTKRAKLKAALTESFGEPENMELAEKHDTRTTRILRRRG